LRLAIAAEFLDKGQKNQDRRLQLAEMSYLWSVSRYS